MEKKFIPLLKRRIRHGYATRLLLIILVSVFVAFFATERSVRTVISMELLKEKEEMLFGLTRQLDRALEGTYDDILQEHGATNLSRKERIEVLHKELKAVTDFVASGIPGVGVGYYSRALDAIITYGPESAFGHTIGKSIFKGHKGYQVMEEGTAMVQQGELVRGRILNCMLPIIRDDRVIGYIWANETLKDVSSRLSAVFERILLFTVIIFILLYIAVLVPTWYFNRRIDQLIFHIKGVMENPRKRLPDMGGPLASVGRGVNTLLDKVFYFKSNNEYIFDSVLSGILAVSMEGEILLANPAFLEMINRKGDKMVGAHFHTVLPEEFGRAVASVVRGNRDRPLQDIVYGGRIIEVFHNDVCNSKGQQIGEVFIFRDRTLLKLYERRLNDQERLAALGEMGLNVAHEIKNPLTAVKGFSQLMRRRSLPQDKVNAYLKLMDEELNRIDKLLNDLLVNGGKSPFLPEPHDFSGIIREFLVIYRNSFPDVHFGIETRINAAPVIKVDRNKIAQLIDNLVKNSVEAMEENGESKEKRIDFLLTVEPEEIYLSIRDSGPGITEANRGRIMTPFFTTKEKGTGLGMGLCLSIVEDHKGRMEIDSEVNRYTEVRLTFNRSELETLDES